MNAASTALTVTFALLVLATALAAFWLVRKAYLGPDGAPTEQHASFRAFFGLGLWMALTAALASSGVLGDFDARPPPMLALMGVTVVAAVWLAFSAFGTRIMSALPLAWLIGFQSFRFPLELVMHWAADEGVMPIQMSYSGSNPDILSGITAIVVAGMLFRGAGTPRTPWLWNVLGTCLLANIVVVAILSTPVFAYWGPDALNVWVTQPPFVWLPTVLVPFALIGHILLWRKLLRQRAEG
ncbi:MAG: hypothetical protein WBG86_07000 [Polyangiales bacterium]